MMLSNLRQQWKDRSLRRSVQVMNGKAKIQSINYCDYDKSCSRNEIPNKYHKSEVPKVEAEEVQATIHIDSSAPKITSSMLQRTFSTSINIDSSQKPFYYLEDNEIMSLDQFFSVYNDLKVQQKLKKKASEKRTVKEKRKKIEEIHTLTQKVLVRSPSIANTPLAQNRSYTLSNLSVVRNLSKPEEPETPNKILQNSAQRPPFLRGNSMPLSYEEFPFFNSDNKSYTKSWKGGISFDNDGPREMTIEQKFNRKEIDKHLICMTVSPKPARPKTANLKEKEKTYSIMFKDPKKMDHNVENSIRRAHRMLVKRMGTSESFGYSLQPEENLTHSMIGEDGFIRDEKVQNENSLMYIKDDDKRKGLLIGKKITNSIKNIEKALKSDGSFFISKSPERSEKFKTCKTIQLKNRLPLRSAIVEKYDFKAKLKDHQVAATKVKDTFKAYQKQSEKSGMTNQGYTSYYH